MKDETGKDCLIFLFLVIPTFSVNYNKIIGTFYTKIFCSYYENKML